MNVKKKKMPACCRTAEKIMTRAQAAKWARRLARAGKTVIFTNGCFDLLHAGHIRYLQYSRSLGDALIVGVNTDSSVRRLNKGPDRPLQKQDDRAYILAGLACVDAICLFDEDTPYETIKAVRPFIITKGKDYKNKTDVVGWDLVESWGGRVVRIDLLAGRSTTGIIKRMLT